MLERKIVRTANEDLPVIKEMNAASTMTLEKRMINLSFIGSVLFVVAEGVMAYISHSHAILMDCVFDVTDLIMIGPFLVLVPLLYRPVTERSTGIDPEEKYFPDTGCLPVYRSDLPFL